MSTKSSTKSKKNSLDLKKFNGTPTLKISSKLFNQIHYLHKTVGKKEWSGPLVYKTIQGDLQEPDNLVMKAEGLFLMDIGTSAGTHFNMSAEESIQLMDNYEGIEVAESRLGLIHTHHNLGSGAYFSGTDEDELKDNSKDYNGYLSLIVSFDLDFVARIAFVTEVERDIKFSFKNMLNNIFSFSTSEETEKVICYYDCDVEVPIEVEDWFKDRYKEVKESNKKTNYTKKYPSYYDNNGYYGYGYNQLNGKQKGEEQFTLQQIEQFLCKLVYMNSNVIAYNLIQAFNIFKYKKRTITEGQVLEIIDDCIEKSVGTSRYENMDVTDKFNFISEAIDYLEAEDNKNKPLTELYELASHIDEILIDIAIGTEEDIEDEYVGF